MSRLEVKQFVTVTVWSETELVDNKGIKKAKRFVKEDVERKTWAKRDLIKVRRKVNQTFPQRIVATVVAESISSPQIIIFQIPAQN